jgi:WD40 repeat protein
VIHVLAIHRIVLMVWLGLSAASLTASETPHAKAKAKRVDRHGDPLPDGALLRLGALRQRTAGRWGFDLSLDGKNLVLTDGSGIHVLDPRTGAERRRFPLPANLLDIFRYSADGRFLLSVDGLHQTVYLDATSGKELRRVEKKRPQPKEPGDIARDIARQGTTLASTLSEDGQMEVMVQEVSYRRLSKRDDEYEYKKKLMGPERTFAQLWDMSNGRELRQIELKVGYRYHIALGRDKKILATFGERDLQGGPPWEHILQLWDTASGKELHQRRFRDKELLRWGDVSPDGKTLAIGGERTIAFWSIAEGRELRRLTLPAGSDCHHLTYSPDGKLLAADAGNGAAVWEADSGKLVGVSPRLSASGVSFAFPAGGGVWAWSTVGRTFCLWEVPSGKQLTPPRSDHLAGIAAVGFAATGRDILSIDVCGVLCRWDATGRLLGRVPLKDEKDNGDGNFEELSRLSPSGDFVLTAHGFRGRGFRLWKAADGETVRDFPPATNAHALPPAFASAGRVALAADYGTIDLGDVNQNHKVKQWEIGKDRLTALALSPDGAWLATANWRSDIRKSDSILVRDTATDRTLCRFHWLENASVGRLTFSPDGRLLAVGSQLGGEVGLYETATGRRWAWLRSPFERGEGGYLNSPLVFSPDGRLLAVAFRPSLYGTTRIEQEPSRINVWEVASGSLRQEFTGQGGVLAALAFSPDGRILASGSSNTTVLLWGLAGASPKAEERLTEKVAERLWTQLAETDARKAYAAILRLSADSDDTVALLRQKLEPLVRQRNAEVRRIDRLIGDLDSDTFEAREKAVRELEQAGRAALPALQKTLRDKPSLEARRRIEALLHKLNQPGPDQTLLQPLRALEILERLGTPEARKLLQTLANEAIDTRLTHEAKSALERLAKRPAVNP